MELIIVEGARGCGKSNITRKLRDRLPSSTLINFTGFSLDGENGLETIAEYYINWMSLLHGMKASDIEQTIICDRMFFSELVYSSLYKSYNFKPMYNMLIDSLKKLNPTILFLTVDNEDTLSERLNRDKIAFSNVKECVEETLKQQMEYEKVFSELTEELNITKIDTTHLNQEGVEKVVLSIIGKD